MFDSLVATTDRLLRGRRGRRLDPGGSRRLRPASAAMVTLLDDAHAAAGSADRDQWCLDNWAAVCAHIGAAARITSGAASSLLLVGPPCGTVSRRWPPCSPTG